MKSFVGNGILLSFVVALVFSSAYAQDVEHPAEPCTGVYAQVGKVVCEEDAVCYQYNEAFTCECKEGFIGDGWAAGAGCYEAGHVEGPGREKRGYIPGMWIPGGHNRGITRCTGFAAFMGRFICDRDASAAAGVGMVYPVVSWDQGANLIWTAT
ncbi:hypothetical protein ACROYT_G023872 [Oculina patagonica]